VKADASLAPWSSLAPLPADAPPSPGLLMHAAALDGENLYVTGGMSGGTARATVRRARLDGTQYRAEIGDGTNPNIDSGWRYGTFVRVQGPAPRHRLHAQGQGPQRRGRGDGRAVAGVHPDPGRGSGRHAVHVHGRRRDELDVRWGAGLNPGTVKYQVEAATSADFGGTVTPGAGGWDASTSRSIPGLQSDTSYYARAQATNRDGKVSPYVLLGATYTLAAQPGAPTFVGVGPTGFTVRWSTGGKPRLDALRSPAGDRDPVHDRGGLVRRPLELDGFHGPAQRDRFLCPGARRQRQRDPHAFADGAAPVTTQGDAVAPGPALRRDRGCSPARRTRCS